MLRVSRRVPPGKVGFGELKKRKIVRLKVPHVVLRVRTDYHAMINAGNVAGSEKLDFLRNGVDGNIERELNREPHPLRISALLQHRPRNDPAPQPGEKYIVRKGLAHAATSLA